MKNSMLVLCLHLYLPSNPRIRQIQEGWKGRIDRMNYLKEKCTSLEDKKSTSFFKAFDAIAMLGGSPLVWDSTLIPSDELEVEVSKINDKWVREFDN